MPYYNHIMSGGDIGEETPVVEPPSSPFDTEPTVDYFVFCTA